MVNAGALRLEASNVRCEEEVVAERKLHQSVQQHVATRSVYIGRQLPELHIFIPRFQARTAKSPACMPSSQPPLAVLQLTH